ncbi:hypothetical protein K461DRAFT_325414 [Myriangium duriaei CBS 260.36]|uniref:Micro-fibrillar-associated protein 1 C-terminal domain-containing protein n=1 Tax=Myriangium duriaei CBS 260.36 TaxID=1168546 RepID=A0A9P4MNZ4_9PEZI|nr:hypothetical protein K461DRAFT_325414 [Myriangium duriaei CBS 260.36]
MPPKRMTANPLAPLRYRAGKPVGVVDAASESESESESESDSETQAPAPRAPPPKAASFPKLGGDLASRQAAAARARANEESARRAADEEGFVTASDSEDGSDAASDSGSESESASESDYESDSSAGRPRFTAPTFVRKAQRDTKPAPPPPQEDDEALRREKADALLQAQLERDKAERAAGKRDWDDEEAGVLEDVDDTDGLDPEAEHAAWRLRELRRVKREREAIEEAEREKEEIERRRNLTAEEREREDAEHIGKQKEEKDARGKMGYMQKYFHKGAFFQADDGGDDHASAAVREAKERDVNAGRFQDDAVNRELLPQYMQIRDMTKLGKKGRTRYRDLKSEDTGRFGSDLYDRKGKGDAGGRYRGRDTEGPTGANDIAVGERRRRDDDGGRGDDKRPRYER